MTATFALSATLHPGNAAGRKMIKDILAGSGVETVCYIGAAHDDSPWREERVAFFKKELGLVVTSPRLSDPKCDAAAAKKAIEGSDVLYLDGGDTVACVRHADARGVVGSFKKAAKRARFVLGLSGGACAAPPFTIDYDDEDRGRVFQCFDMGPPHPLDVHDEADDWPEMRALLEVVKRDRPDLDARGIVAPTGATLIVTPAGELRSWGKTPCERRKLGARGKWEIEKLPAV